MEKTIKEIRANQKGFTLVELAVVMIIIGLLIGGVLKGQELIANAQVTSTVSALKGMDAATSTFVDQFRAFPGDMANAQNRLRDCAAPCVSGSGNGRIVEGVGAAPVVPADGGATGENVGYFIHLQRADMISGVDGTADLVFGAGLPAAPVGGGVTVGHTSAAANPGFTDAELRPGHYLVLTGTTAAVAAGQGELTPAQAANIDRKMDDGAPDTGSVIAQTGADADCRTDDAGTAIYAEAQTDRVCAIAVRIQG